MISKLRGASGDDGRRVIEAVHRMGNSIGAPIVLAQPPKRARLAMTLTADYVVGRWEIAPSQTSVKTGEARVSKFADTGSSLDALRREAAISQLLHEP